MKFKTWRDHLTFILNFWKEKTPPKYTHGVHEHGGDLWKKNLGPEITGELTDLITYWPTYLAQVDRLVKAIHAYISIPSDLESYTELQEALAPFHYEMKKNDD
jgi:hypothetical protein